MLRCQRRIDSRERTWFRRCWELSRAPVNRTVYFVACVVRQRYVHGRPRCVIRRGLATCAEARYRILLQPKWRLVGRQLECRRFVVDGVRCAGVAARRDARGACWDGVAPAREGE